MKKLEYSIDQKEYDMCVLGTGMTEALFSASLSKIERKKVIQINILIIDADTGYSSSQKTFNLKELQNEIEDKCKSELKKDFFKTLEVSEEQAKRNQSFINENVLNSTLYKQFNIDQQPKLLFSTSLTVECMKQANMDQYMNFRAVDAIYFFDVTSKKLIQTPCSKSDIFKSKEFSLLEKKQLFQFLHKCSTLYNRAFGQEVNQNSTQEFDKEFEVDEATLALYNSLKDQSCMQFLQEAIPNKKIQDIFLYNLCNYEYNPNESIPQFLREDYTTKSFLHRLNKYIKSCGVHTPLPYLYTNYGTGDIPQGYARITAIFGSVFCINKNIEISSIQRDQSNSSFLIKSNLVKQPEEVGRDEGHIESVKKQEMEEQVNGQEQMSSKEEEKVPVSQQDNYIHVKSIIAGPEYKERIKELLGMELQEVREETYLLRVTIISKKSEEQLKVELQEDAFNEEDKADRSQRYACPILYSIPPNDIIKNKQPLSILQLDSHSMSTPKSHQVFYCKKVLENIHDYHAEVQSIVQFVENIHTYKKELPFQYTADFVWAYTQNKNDQGLFEFSETPEKTCQLALVGQDFFEIDMDKNFEEFRNNIPCISKVINNKDENYFQTIEEINGEVDFYQNKTRLDHDEDGEIGIDKIISQFEELKQNNLPKSETEQQ